MYEFLNKNIESELKTHLFIKKIKKYRETKDFHFVLDIKFNTPSLLFLTFLKYIYYLCLTSIVIGLIITTIIILIVYSIKTPNQTSGIIALIAGTLSAFVVIYGTYINRKNNKEARFDNSIYLLIQYLIEIKKENYNYKIFKDDLSFIFMNIPNNILFILRDIQDNIKEVQNSKKEMIGNYKKVLDIEILFLISYIREYYGIADTDFNHYIEQIDMLNDIIINSSRTKTVVAVKNVKTDNKKSKRKD